MKGKGQMIYFPEDVWKKLKRLKNKSAKVSGVLRDFYAKRSKENKGLVLTFRNWRKTKAGQDEGK